MRTAIIVSACLLGEPVRYDGGTKPCPAVIALTGCDGVEVVPVCPETAAGLPVPRPPAEQRGGGVFLSDGRDVTEAFAAGSAACAEAALASGARIAILKAKSPSCGAGEIYDGTYSGTLVPGWGTFARLLRDAGVEVLTERDVESAFADVRAGKLCKESILPLVREALGLL